MKPEDIHLYDIGRIIMGEVPAGFLLEVVLRVLFLFALLIVSMRLMGSRMASNMTVNELAAMSSLAAAIGVPMQSPDKGLLPALIIAVAVIAFQRFIALGTFKNRKVEKLIQDGTSILVENGCLNLKELKKVGLSRERVFAQLRSLSVDNLGKVQRLYMESSGKFSLLEQSEPKPGLPVIPDWDMDFTKDQPHPPGLYACGSCGNMVQGEKYTRHKCTSCGHQEWKKAVQC